MYMYMQKVSNLAIGCKTIRNVHPTQQRAIDYAQKIEREFSLAEGIQQTEFDMVMLIDMTTRNDPIGQQRLAN